MADLFDDPVSPLSERGSVKWTFGQLDPDDSFAPKNRSIGAKPTRFISSVPAVGQRNAAVGANMNNSSPDPKMRE